MQLNLRHFPSLKTMAGILLCVLGMVLTAHLGAWQLRRAAQQDHRLEQMQRQAQLPPLQHLPCLQAALSAAPPAALPAANPKILPYQPVHLRGHFLPNTLVYIDNRQVQGHPAVQVVQAFVPETAPGVPGCVVAVDRGYVLRNPAAPRQVPVPPPATQNTQPQHLQAWAVLTLPRSAELQTWFGLSKMHSEKTHQEYVQGQWMWSNVQHSTYAKHLNALGVALPVASFFLTEQVLSLNTTTAATTAATTAKPLPTHTAQGLQPSGLRHVPWLLPHKADKHRAYAAQWYGLCAVLVVALLAMFYRYVRMRRAK